MSSRSRVAVLPAVAGSTLTLALLAGGTGVAIASWTGAASADLPASSVNYIPAAPTSSAKTCTIIINTLTSATMNFVAVNDRATYQLLRGATVVATFSGTYTTGEALSHVDNPSGATSQSYTVRATVGAVSWTSSATVVSCP